MPKRFSKIVINFVLNVFLCRDRLKDCLAGGGGGESKADSGELFLYSPLKVVFFVAMMCGMLVLMYFFYNVLGEWDKKKLLSCTLKD